jgi:hypothetical protein
MDRDATDSVAGDLRHAFDAIAAELDKVRRDSEAYNRQLLQRNRELAAIAAVAQAISTEQVDLAAMLERTLQIILEVTGLPAGWVMLLPEGGGESVLASSAGLPLRSLRDKPFFDLPNVSVARSSTPGFRWWFTLCIPLAQSTRWIWGTARRRPATLRCHC